MKIDKKLLNKLLMLNDRQLETVVRKLVEDAGLDLGAFDLTPNDLDGIRRMLEGATDEDIEMLSNQLNMFGGGGK